MATLYTFKFTDQSKLDFTVQPYTSNGILSPSDNTKIPNATSANTTLKIYGKGMQEYGEGIEQNLIYLLENFANSTRPEISIEGQMWYNNIGVGSPPLGPELYIRNASTNDLTGWDAVILATGTSAMTGELVLSGTPANPLAAIPKIYVDNHAADFTLHLTPDQSFLLNGLTLPTLTPDEVNQLIGINTTINVQTQIDEKINRAGDAMDASANLTFNGGEVLGLPATPSNNFAAASKAYVDSTIATGGGDGRLTIVDWTTPPTEPLSPGNTLVFTISQTGQPDTILTAYGISREGHTHIALETAYDNTLNTAYPINVQGAIDYIESNKSDLLDPIFINDITVANNISAISASFTGAVTGIDPIISNELATKNYVDNASQGNNALVVTRTIQTLSADIPTAPLTPYLVQNHVAGDNLLSITISGMKQYVASVASQNIVFFDTVSGTDVSSFTGLDNSIDYDFNIAVDGGAPTTVTIPAGSSIATHGDLINTINNGLVIGSPAFPIATYGFLSNSNSDIAIFIGNTTGSTAAIAITDPVTANQYLFATDPSPLAITGGVYNSNPPPSGAPDLITVSGDVTANFPVGKTFTISGSVDPLYETYDDVYSVHTNGATYDGSTSTSIPVAEVNDPTINKPLFIGYTPPTNPPVPSALGSIYLVPLGAFDQISSAVNGIDGDYIETDDTGTETLIGEPTEFVVFNVTIPTGTTIETLLLE